MEWREFISEQAKSHAATINCNLAWQAGKEKCEETDSHECSIHECQYESCCDGSPDA